MVYETAIRHEAALRAAARLEFAEREVLRQEAIQADASRRDDTCVEVVHKGAVSFSSNAIQEIVVDSCCDLSFNWL